MEQDSIEKLQSEQMIEFKIPMTSSVSQNYTITSYWQANNLKCGKDRLASR